MARSHARIAAGIYQLDDDWRALPMAAQWLYTQMLTQIGMKQCGVLTLQLEKWTAGCSDAERGDVDKALLILEERRYVVVDRSTWEVLVRSFIRRDGVYKHPNTLKAALRTAHEEVESRVLKVAIAAELRRLGLDRAAAELDPDGPEPDGPGTQPDPNAMPSSTHPDGIEMPSRSDRDMPSKSTQPDAISMPSRSDAVTPRGRGEGGVVSSCPVVGSVRSAAKRGARLPETFVVTTAMADWARRDFPNVDAERETEKFRDYFRAAPGAKGVKADWPATWRNWIRKAEELADARPGSHLRAVAVVPADPDAAFADLRHRADAQAAALLIRIPWVESFQPPDDDTPPWEWLHDRAVEFIDAHAAEIRAALTERKTG